MGEAFDYIPPSKWGGKQKPQIHIVQTTACHPIAKKFDTDFTTTDVSPAGAIVDKIAHRKDKVVNIIKKTNGCGWVVCDEDIHQAQKLIEDTCNILVSPNAALSIAGLKKSLEKGRTYTGVIVCLLTGM